MSADSLEDVVIVGHRIPVDIVPRQQLARTPDRDQRQVVLPGRTANSVDNDSMLGVPPQWHMSRTRAEASACLLGDVSRRQRFGSCSSGESRHAKALQTQHH